MWVNTIVLTSPMRDPSQAATGNERKLAEASPSVASNAIQHRMMPSPRMKFTPKPPSR